MLPIVALWLGSPAIARALSGPVHSGKDRLNAAGVTADMGEPAGVEASVSAGRTSTAGRTAPCRHRRTLPGSSSPRR